MESGLCLREAIHSSSVNAVHPALEVSHLGNALGDFKSVFEPFKKIVYF